MSDETLYDRLRNDIAELVEKHSCGPLLIRLSWHDSGTFCSKTMSGGAHAAMRFSNSHEARDDANAGLDKARKLLEPLKEKYPEVSYADLWSLAAVVSIKEMKGPDIPWRPGRKDAEDPSESVECGRLPNAEKGCKHLRRVFGRMKFSDQDIVALSGAHTVGSAHSDRSGYTGSWTKNPTVFDNSYFITLIRYAWMPTPGRTGCTIFKPAEDSSSPIIMLPSDVALLQDLEMKRWVETYAESQDTFFTDFTDAFVRLQELSIE